MRSYPNASVIKNMEKGFVEYNYSNDESENYVRNNLKNKKYFILTILILQHLLKSKELLDLTLNTVELLKLQAN